MWRCDSSRTAAVLVQMKPVLLGFPIGQPSRRFHSLPQDAVQAVTAVPEAYLAAREAWSWKHAVPLDPMPHLPAAYKPSGHTLLGYIAAWCDRVREGWSSLREGRQDLHAPSSVPAAHEPARAYTAANNTGVVTWQFPTYHTPPTAASRSTAAAAAHRCPAPTVTITACYIHTRRLGRGYTPQATVAHLATRMTAVVQTFYTGLVATPDADHGAAPRPCCGIIVRDTTGLFRDCRVMSAAWCPEGLPVVPQPLRVYSKHSVIVHTPAIVDGAVPAAEEDDEEYAWWGGSYGSVPVPPPRHKAVTAPQWRLEELRP